MSAGKPADAGGSALKSSVNAPVFVPGKSGSGGGKSAQGSSQPSGKAGQQQGGAASKGSGGKGSSGQANAAAQPAAGGGGSSSSAASKLSAAAVSAPVFVPKTEGTTKSGAAPGGSGKNAAANSSSVAASKGAGNSSSSGGGAAAGAKSAGSSSSSSSGQGKAGSAGGASSTGGKQAAGNSSQQNAAGKGTSGSGSGSAGAKGSTGPQSPKPSAAEKRQQQQQQEKGQGQGKQQGRQQHGNRSGGKGSSAGGANSSGGGAGANQAGKSAAGAAAAATAAAAPESSPNGSGKGASSNTAVAPSSSSGSISSSGGGAAAAGGAAKMSATAAAFVPGKSPGASGGSAAKPPPQPPPQQPGPAEKQQQSPPLPAQQQGGNRGPANVLRSPGRARNFGSMGGAGPYAPHMAPGGGGRGRGGPGGGASGGGRGPGGMRMDFPPGPGGVPGGGGGPGGRAGPMGMLGGFHQVLGGLGVPPLYPPGPPGMKRGGGPPAALASHPGNYFQQQGLFQAGPGRQLMAARFMSENLRHQLQQQSYLAHAKWTGVDESQVAENINQFHTLYPLEDPSTSEDGSSRGVSASLGVRSIAVKGLSAHDGQPYLLRVVDGKQVLPSLELLSAARQAIDTWMILSGHPNLCCPCEAFVSSDWDGSPSLVLVYPFYPGALTLAQAHLMPTQTPSGQLVRNQAPSEEALWNYTVQLACALRAVHAAGLAVRPACLSPNKVLLTPLGRLRLGCLGLLDALNGDSIPQSPEELLMAQREDVVAMGQLLLTLACSLGAVPLPSMEFASMHYSPDFVRLLALLLGVAEGGVFSWRHLIALLGERILQEHDSLSMFNDHLVSDLSLEMENGRLFRLMAKLDFINERPEGDMMASWSETGDRYLLKLFRDFVFHQATEDGTPAIDWGHVVECLNKLDMGVPEEVLLMSRDEQVLLVVTYADIKRCLESAYEELRGGSSSGGAAGPVGPMLGSSGGAYGGLRMP